MTLSQIMTLALRQLDEDAQDISEYESAFRVYANIGYDIAVREHLRPKEWFCIESDEQGMAALTQGNILRVVMVKEKESGRPATFRLLEDGTGMMMPERNTAYEALCEVSRPDMTQETDEPMLPERVHHALADYICYRHLSAGSIAKQARAQFFLTSFLHAMRSLRPQGMGSEGRYKNLYAATNLGNAR